MNADSAANLSNNFEHVEYNMQRLSVDEDKETPVATTEAVPQVAQPNDVDAFEDDVFLPSAVDDARAAPNSSEEERSSAALVFAPSKSPADPQRATALRGVLSGVNGERLGVTASEEANVVSNQRRSKRTDQLQGGNTILQNTPSVVPDDLKKLEEREFWTFVHKEVCVRKTYSAVTEDLCAEFLKTIVSDTHAKVLHYEYQYRMLQNIHRHADFLTFETMNDLLETLQIKLDKDAVRSLERSYNATFHVNVFQQSRGARPLAPTTIEGEENSRMEVVRSTGRRQQDIPLIQRQPVTPVDRPPHSTSSQLPRPPTTAVDKAKKRGRVGSDVTAPSPNQPPEKWSKSSDATADDSP